MNDAARSHLDKAEEFLARGDEFYLKAGKEMAAAMSADPQLSYRAVGERFGKGETWARELVLWATNPRPSGETSPRWHRGSHATTAEIEEGAEKLLRENPDALLDRLPTEQRAAIATSLVAQEEVREQIRAGDELVTSTHWELATELARDSDRRSVDRGRRESRTIRDVEASRLLSDAAKLIADANAILFQHATADDDLYRCDTAMERVEGHVKRYHEIRETAPVRD